MAMASSESEVASIAPITSEEIEAELDRRGHVATSWDELGSITLEQTGIVTSQ